MLRPGSSISVLSSRQNPLPWGCLGQLEEGAQIKGLCDL